MDRRTRPTSYASLPIEHYPAFAFTTFGDDQWPVTYQLTSRVIPLKCHCTTTRPDLNKKIQTHTLFVRNSSGAQSVFGAGGIQPTSVTAPPSLANRSEKVVRLALQLPFMAKSFRRSFLCCALSARFCLSLALLAIHFHVHGSLWHSSLHVPPYAYLDLFVWGCGRTNNKS